jgi:hypothetical protein
MFKYFDFSSLKLKFAGNQQILTLETKSQKSKIKKICTFRNEFATKKIS